jgi:LAO/AO transport system kinase
VVAAIDEHRAWMESSGELERRRVRRARDEIEAIAVTALRERWGDVHGRNELDDLAEQVAAGKTDPYRAADVLLDSFTELDRATP